jgi:hypothetical protein
LEMHVTAKSAYLMFTVALIVFGYNRNHSPLLTFGDATVP